ncbi:hypothetical protein JCM19231_1430 [Vibrio ishigakensis]|uniref:Uncharacterized protein n=1 Tax=Vibrio ishigakensis TaxID=1481914 RepID=A0A0B8P2S6_9VIBR|nr:hypothetical protein JCM19231_1430 [Vibrio ishigakensis]
MNSVSSNPTVGLYKIAVEDGMDNYGLVLSGGGIGGKLDLKTKNLAWSFWLGTTMDNLKVTGESLGIKPN